jgi:3-dehydroquinate synthase
VATIPIAVPGTPPTRYDVVVEPGALSRLGMLVTAAAPAARYAVLADERVARLYGDVVCTALARAGARADLVPFAAGEARKTVATWAELCDALVRLGVGRDGCIIALGGGVTGDVAGFVAATYLRGIDFVQVPTTLLAMVDASVGGKTGVDTPAGKNLVGAFHQPRLVVADPDVLASLPEAELRAGLVEAVKHGVIADAAYLERTVRDAAAILRRDAAVLGALVARSVEIKAEVVAEDPREAGRRATLNFGHTIGHALEALSGYELSHGYAVAAGMVAEATIGEAVGVTAPGTASAIREALGALGVPTAWPEWAAPDAVLARSRHDKKVRAGQVRYSLVARVGEAARTADGAWTHPVPDTVAAQALASLARATPFRLGGM